MSVRRRYPGLSDLIDHIQELKSEEQSVVTLDADMLENPTPVPPHLSGLHYAEQLTLTSNGLFYDLPESIGQFTKLTKLVLDHNAFEVLPEELGELTALTELSVAHNCLETLPSSMDSLVSLRRLNLSDNNLATLPDTLFDLEDLVELKLSNNQMTELNPLIGHLEQLQILDLSGNELTGLPDQIGKLAELRSLFLDKNRIDDLPRTLKSLTSLTFMSLQRNKLVQYPEALSDLPSIQSLQLSYNRLTFVSPSIERLVPKLTRLYLAGNLLHDLPNELRLFKFQELDLRENPLNLELPRETKALQAFLAERDSHTRRMSTDDGGDTSVCDEFLVEKVLDHRTYYGRSQYLVKWDGYSDEENSWAYAEDIGSYEAIHSYLAESKRKSDLASKSKKSKSRKRPRSPDAVAEDDTVYVRTRNRKTWFDEANHFEAHPGKSDVEVFFNDAATVVEDDSSPPPYSGAAGGKDYSTIAEDEDEVVPVTDKIGFHHGDRLLSILGCKKRADRLYAVVLWETSNGGKATTLVPVRHIRRSDPQALIKFYESRICWLPGGAMS